MAPSEFWGATPRELAWAFSGYVRQFDGNGPEDHDLSDDAVEEAMNRFPDG